MGKKEAGMNGWMDGYVLQRSVFHPKEQRGFAWVDGDMNNPSIRSFIEESKGRIHASVQACKACLVEVPEGLQRPARRHQDPVPACARSGGRNEQVRRFRPLAL